MTSSTFLARRAAVLRGAFALLLAGTTGLAAAQTGPWPNRPIRIVIPYAAGSSPDVFARIVADKIGPKLGQQVLVDNRPGGGGNTGTGAVAHSPGDGYTFVISTNGPLVYNTVLYKKLGYDPFTELRPVVLGGAQANVCAVRSDSGIKSLGELVKAMKASPGKFNFSSTGVGSLSHLGVELLKAKTDSFAVHIPYASSPLAILALLQGLGRLIRHRRDRGVLAILDPRLRTKGYGRRFLGSLPPAPIVHELAAVQRFLSIV